MKKTILASILAGVCCLGCKDRSESNATAVGQPPPVKDNTTQYQRENFVGIWTSDLVYTAATLQTEVELKDNGQSIWNRTLTKGGKTRQYREEGTWRIVDGAFGLTITNSTMLKVEEPPTEETYKLLAVTPDEFRYQTEKRVWVYKRKK